MKDFQLPTDNLYKFIALSGLVLAVFSIYMENVSKKEIRQAANQIEQQAASADKTMGTADRVWNSLGDELADFEKLIEKVK